MRRVGRAAAAVMVSAFAVLAYVYLTLPDVRLLRPPPPKTTAFIELRARESMAHGQRPRRVQRWVPYRQISNHLKRAVLVAEDSAFWDHEGVDCRARFASRSKPTGARTLARGGSTITQQLAKNLYLSPSRNPVRKLRELFIARRLEAELSKLRILELYLNVIEWGVGMYGAEAAARTYFRKSASALGPEESAMLAGAIINPRVFNPSQPNARLRRRQRLILRRMGRSSRRRRKQRGRSHRRPRQICGRMGQHPGESAPAPPLRHPPINGAVEPIHRARRCHRRMPRRPRLRRKRPQLSRRHDRRA